MRNGRGAGSVQQEGRQQASGNPTPASLASHPIPPKLYRIGEIVDYAKVSRQTIHNYTTMGLITESRRSMGGHRLYDEGVFLRLNLIAEMRGQQKSLREIRRRFARMVAAT